MKKYRLEEMKKIISLEKHIAIKDMADLLKVSEITVRRYLQMLQKDMGLLLDRGVIYLVSNNDFPFSARLQINSNGKKQIAEKAFKKIKEGDVIALDLGSTTLELAYLIAEYSAGITIFTSSLTIAQVLAKNENIDVYIVPGIIRKHELSICGVLAIELINKFNFDIFFMSAAGFYQDTFYEYVIEETEVKKSFINQSKQTIVLVDKTKYGKRSVVEVCKLEQVDEIITDSGDE